MPRSVAPSRVRVCNLRATNTCCYRLQLLPDPWLSVLRLTPSDDSDVSAQSVHLSDSCQSNAKSARVEVRGGFGPWILIVGALGFLAAWLVVAIMEYTGLSRHVWHLALFFAGLIILFSSL